MGKSINTGDEMLSIRNIIIMLEKLGVPARVLAPLVTYNSNPTASDHWIVDVETLSGGIKVRAYRSLFGHITVFTSGGMTPIKFDMGEERLITKWLNQEGVPICPPTVHNNKYLDTLGHPEPSRTWVEVPITDKRNER